MSKQQQQYSSLWYKNPWVWYIIFMKVAVITASMVTAWLIYQNPASMVVDEYYDEGRTINLQLAKVARAEELDLSFYVDIVGDRLEMRFRSGEPADRTALLVTFYHPTLHDMDFEVRVPHSADGIYRQRMPVAPEGHWRIDVEPFDQEWRVSQNVLLPAPDTLTLEPVNYGI